jgi:hypothetical protein
MPTAMLKPVVVPTLFGLLLLGLVGCDEPAQDAETATGQAAEVSCPEGKTRVAQQHCCFRGQRWDTDEQACKGTPTCESGTSYGDGCPPDALDAAEQVEWLTLACDAGEHDACGMLAGRYLTGTGVDKSTEKARSLASDACEAEAWNACNTLGTIFVQGRGDQANPEKARTFFSMACKHDDGEGCKNLALLYAKGIGVDADQTRARQLYQTSCDLGFEPSCTVVERMKKMARERASKSLANATAACDGGDQEACARAGRILLHGQAGSADVDRAVELLEQSCGAGVGEACRVLATAYYAGKNVPRDLERALDLAERGCSLGQTDACNILGLLYLLPPGPTPDLAKARSVLRPGCDDENPRSCANLGRALLAEDDSIDADPDSARNVLALACKKGIADSCERLARLWQDGLGGPADGDKAASLRERACELGSEAACRKSQ